MVDNRDGRAHGAVGNDAGEPLITDDGGRDPKAQEPFDRRDPGVQVELIAAEPDAARAEKVVEGIAILPPVQTIVERSLQEIAERLALDVGAQGGPEAASTPDVVAML